MWLCWDFSPTDCSISAHMFKADSIWIIQIPIINTEGILISLTQVESPVKRISEEERWKVER